MKCFLAAFLVGITLFTCSADRALSQTSASSDGTEFYVTFFSGQTYLPTVTAQICAFQSSLVKLYYFDTSGRESLDTAFLLDPMTCASIYLNTKYLTFTDSTKSYSSIHIVSDKPITVQMYGSGYGTTEMYLALPTSMLGTAYSVASYTNSTKNGTSIEQFSPTLSTFMVIGTAPNTKVHIKSSVNTRSPLPDTIVLQPGQVLRVRARDPLKCDLSGSLVQSSLPVVVLTGHEGAELPDIDTLWPTRWDNLQNMLIEELLPLKDWESSGYYVIPFQDPIPSTRLLRADTGDLIRVFSGPGLNSNLKIRIGKATGTGTASSTPFAINQLDSGASITSVDSSPIGVMQYDYYQGFDDRNVTSSVAAPVMMSVIPYALWKYDYLWMVPQRSGFNGGQYSMMIYHVAAPPRLYKGKTLVAFPPSGPTFQIPGHPELVGENYRLAAGTYHAVSDSSFVVYSYGRSEYNAKATMAYAAPCGTLTTQENIPPIGLAIDTGCTTWSGIIRDGRTKILRPQAILIVTDPLAVRAGLRVTTNALLDTERLNDSVWTFHASVTDPFKQSDVTIYMQDLFGLHIISHFHYEPPKWIVSGIRNIGRMNVGYDTCTTITITNPLDSTTVLIDTVGSQSNLRAFRLTSCDSALPTRLKPHALMHFHLCAAGHSPDTTYQDTLALATSCNSIPIALTLATISPRVNWTAPSAEDSLICGKPDTVRLWLVNDNLKDGQEDVEAVTLQGADVSEFSIVGNELGYDPLVNFPMDAGQKIWVDVAFHPDMNKPEPDRWADRHAKLVATNLLHNDPEVELTAHILQPTLSSDQSSADLGVVLVGGSGHAAVVIRDTGSATVSISAVTIGDSRITASGILSGDTIRPGESRTITLDGTLLQADSINTQLTITAGPSCANPITLPVTFLAYSKGSVSATSTGVGFPLTFLCSHRSGPATFTNTGTDTITVDHATITGSNAFSFADGSQYLLLRKRLAPDSSITLTITSAPTTQGISNGSLAFAWDSSIYQVMSNAPLTTVAQSASAALQVAAPSVTGNGVPSNMIYVPVDLTQPPPAGLNAQRAKLTLRYRRDLFAFGAVSSSYKIENQTVAADGNGNELLTLLLSSSTGFNAAELARLQFEVMLSLDTETSLDILDVQFFDATMQDTFCVDVSQQSSSFKPRDLCSAIALRTYMASGSLPLNFESIEPNPGTGEFQLGISASNSLTVHIGVYNLLGAGLFSMDRSVHSGHNNVALDLGTLGEGSYIVEISDGSQSIRKKLVIQR